MKYKINQVHKKYGKVVGIGIKEGKEVRYFKKNGVISLIPLNMLK